MNALDRLGGEERKPQGNAPAWKLVFHGETDAASALGNAADDPGGAVVGAIVDLLGLDPLGLGPRLFEISQDDYYAEIEAALPHGLAGGGCSVRLHGLTDDHYQQLRKAHAAEGTALTFKLHLSWRDLAKNPEDLVDPDRDLVGVFAVTSVGRTAAGLRRVGVIEARDLAFHRLASRRVHRRIEADTHLDAATALFEQFGFADGGFIRHPDGGGIAAAVASAVADLADALTGGSEEEKKPEVTIERGRLGTSALEELAGQIADAENRHGRGTVLLRDGVVHVGAERPITDSSNQKRVTAAGGLIEAKVTGKSPKDPQFDFKEDPSKLEPPSRDRFALKLKGRGDIKPGNLLAFVPTPEDASGNVLQKLAGDLVAMPVEDWSRAITIYVEAVQHRLAKNAGFFTTLTGVVVDPEGDAHAVWDQHSKREQPEEAAETVPGDGSEEHALAQEIIRRSRIARGMRSTTMGEIRRHVAADDPDQPGPRFSSAVLTGLEPRDGRPDQLRRADFARDPDNWSGRQPVGYLSPFAWGPCGLVLPRYPGTRVMLAFNEGVASEPVDIGAIWPTPTPDRAQGPPGAEQGDWWLVMPADVAPGESFTAPEPEAIEPYAGKVSHDLTTAAGERTIEIGTFVVRAGKDKLPDTGSRPAPPGEVDSITLEQRSSGSKILMKANGDIEIQAKGKLILSADSDVEVNAANVKVSLAGGTMDVE